MTAPRRCTSPLKCRRVRTAGGAAGWLAKACRAKVNCVPTAPDIRLRFRKSRPIAPTPDLYSKNGNTGALGRHSAEMEFAKENAGGWPRAQIGRTIAARSTEV